MHCYFVVLVRVNVFHGMNSLPALSLCVSKALDVLTFLMKRNVLSNNVHFPSSFPIFCAKQMVFDKPDKFWWVNQTSSFFVSLVRNVEASCFIVSIFSSFIRP